MNGSKPKEIIEGPPAKKTKIDNSNMTFTIDSYLNLLKTSEKPLKVVLNDDISKPLPIIEVYVGHIKDVKNISKTVLLLNEKLPVKELQHLKRVKKQDIVLCPSNYLNGLSILEYLEECDQNFKDIFDSFVVKEVPKLPPKLKNQYEETKKYWPCNFHPDKYLEKLFSDNFFSAQENILHRKYMEMAFYTSKWYSENVSKNSDEPYATVVVDPSINSVVAVAIDNRQEHPMQHSAVLAIDNVARTQNGGAWLPNHKLDDGTFICSDLLNFLKDKFPDFHFGHKQFKNKQVIEHTDQFNEDNEYSNHDGPYLCTGYYVYTLKEPCVMCSMALVHARAKRVFFCIDNEKDGALKSKVMLQTVSSLNHRFEVFTGFL